MNRHNTGAHPSNHGRAGLWLRLGSKRPLLTLLLVAYFLMSAAWVFGNPQGAAPDEYAHYLRALAAGRGELILRRSPPPLAGRQKSDVSLRWQQRQTRLVRVAQRLSPEALNCNRFNPRLRWQCPEKIPLNKPAGTFKTWVGTYSPYLYVLPGLAMKLASSTVPAMYMGRAAFFLICLALLGLAAWSLWDPRSGAASQLGLVLAVTPTVVFVGSSLSPSGPEIFGGICFFACLLRLTRAEPTPALIWFALVVSGGVLVLSRDLGPVWLFLDVGLAVAFSGMNAIKYLLNNNRKALVVTGSALAAALAVGLWWQFNRQVHPNIGAGIFGPVGGSLGALPTIIRQETAVFGAAASTDLPRAGVAAWLLMIALMVGLGLFFGKWRERAVLTASIACGLLITVALDLAQRQVGFGVQGRHVLPFAVAIPLMAAEIVSRKLTRTRWSRLAVAGLPFIAGLTLMSAWFFNARSHVSGPSGRLLFFGSQRFSPAGGWLTWAGVMAVGAGMLIAWGALGAFWMPNDPIED